MARRRMGTHLPYLFISIPIVILLLIGLYPLIFSVWMSFHWWPLVQYKAPYIIGAENYIKLVTSSHFTQVLLNTGIYVVGSVGMAFFIGLGLALLMQSESKIMDSLRAYFLLPILMAPVAVALVFRFLYNPLYGPLSLILMQMGLFVNFQSRELALFSIILTDVWQWTPFMFLVLLSGILYIPKEHYEAAEVDGVNLWQKLRYITIPYLKPLILIILLLRGTVCFGELDKIYVITRGGPGRATQTLVYQAYETGFQTYVIGEAAAIGFFILILVNIFYIVIAKVFKE